MKPESIREVFRGTKIRVAVESWPAGKREVVHHPGATAIVAVTPAADVILVRQMREAVRSSLVEIPAGTLDRPSEDPLSCAERELMEETGYQAAETRFLGGIYTSPGFSDEYVHLFMSGASAEPLVEPEEGIDVVRMPFSQAVRAARAGRIRDAKTSLALLLAAARGQSV